MKEIFKKIIISILTFESKLVLKRFKPKIIAITGNVGKTGTKDAIYTALSKTLYVRKNQKSFNSEIGTPLTILGLQNAWSSPWGWIFNCIKGLLVLFKFKYPKWLVLEIGVDRPGDIEHVAKYLKPDVVVFTAFPKVPVHVEYFDTPEDVIKEKKGLMKYLKPSGTLVLNADDDVVLKTKEEAKTKVITYGSKEGADVFVSHDSVIYEDFDGIKYPTGISFRVNYEGNSVPVSLPGVLGIQHMYPVVAAIATGLSIDVPFLDMTNSFSTHEPPKGRMNIIDGENKTVIIDDSYNASPLAMEKAVEVLADLQMPGQKIAVLGDMLEIGHFSQREHKRIGKMITDKKINHLFTVGIRSEDIAKEAILNGMNENNVHVYKNSTEVIPDLKKLLNPANVILVKGSQGVRMEKIIKEIMEHKDQAKDLLVRQEKVWEDK